MNSSHKRRGDDYYASRNRGQSEIRPRRDPVVYGSSGIRANGSLSEEQIASYEKNGYLFFPDLFPDSKITSLLEELSRLASVSDRRDRPEYITEPGSGDVRSIFRIHASNPVFRALSRDSRLVEVARQILGSDVYVHQSRINLKPAFSGKEFYWHSDFETWHMEDGMPQMRALSCSITLTDNFSFNGPLMLIPGSHRHYVECAGETPEDHYKKSLKKQEYGVPSHENLRHLINGRGIDAPVGPAGSVIFFDCNIMHGSNGNITPFPRTNIFIVYNSIENRVEDPFGGMKPRPEFIATRKFVKPLRSVKGKAKP